MKKDVLVSELSRRRFIRITSAAACGVAAGLPLRGQNAPGASQGKAPFIIDLHQHTNYSGRSNERFLAHQEAMGIGITILLPAGRAIQTRSTHDGRSNGLAAQCGGNETVYQVAKDHPKQYRFFANEVVDLPDAVSSVEAYLKKGAIGIGEQKFSVAADSQPIRAMAELAGEYDVPILLHFQHNAYNTGIERFHKILEAYPKVRFIGHAQTWWGNIDKNHKQPVMYPSGKVTPGGITDRLLSDYPNMFGDLSAGSGLNALIRDEEHTRGFLRRHQDKLLYGSDCNDVLGRGPGCQGSRTIATLQRLAPDEKALQKIFSGNARRVMRI